MICSKNQFDFSYLSQKKVWACESSKLSNLKSEINLWRKVFFRLSRQSRGGEAVMTIEIDGSFGPELNEKIKVLPNIFSSTMLQPI